MNQPVLSVALFGGSFDPVHRGHLKVARAAVERFHLSQVYFVPAYLQPLKAGNPVTSFYHRYAMLALALQGEERFVPSLLEAPELGQPSQRPSYSIETVARLRAQLPTGTRLFFLIGMDAFAHIAKWRAAVELLRSVEFIVASRPGFALEQVPRALPAMLRPDERTERKLLQSGALEKEGLRLYLLPGVQEEVSATAIRSAAHAASQARSTVPVEALEKLVPAAVADYIRKLRIY